MTTPNNNPVQKPKTQIIQPLIEPDDTTIDEPVVSFGRDEPRDETAAPVKPEDEVKK